jgi:hypothetical protein
MAAICVQAIWTASAASISSFGAAASIIASAAFNEVSEIPPLLDTLTQVGGDGGRHSRLPFITHACRDHRQGEDSGLMVVAGDDRFRLGRRLLYPSTTIGNSTMDTAQTRAAMIAHLERAFEYAEEIKDGSTAYLIERAIDEARSQLISSPPTAGELN